MVNNEPKYPDVKVHLTGQDGNGFFIISRTMKALKAAGHSDAADAYREEAESGDYDHLLQTTMAWVDVS